MAVVCTAPLAVYLGNR